MAPSAHLDVSRLSVLRGEREVVCGVSLRIAPGEVVALLGPNSAGKSTLLLAASGLLPMRAGSVTLGGRPLAGLGPDGVRRAGVALVPEGHRVLEVLDVRDNLRAAGSFLRAGALATRIDVALGVLPELRRVWRSSAGSLSGGQKQMVAIAQALVADPGYLLVDELSLGLAPAVVSRLAELLRDLARTGVGILLVEQFTSVALSLASRAYVLDRGSLVFEGPSERLREQPELLHQAYLAGEAVRERAGAPLQPGT